MRLSLHIVIATTCMHMLCMIARSIQMEYKTPYGVIGFLAGAPLAASSRKWLALLASSMQGWRGVSGSSAASKAPPKPKATLRQHLTRTIDHERTFMLTKSETKSPAALISSEVAS